jgi:hypothetical protein
VLALLLIVGGFVAWTVNSSGALDHQVAAYRAAGEPIEPGDFVVTGVRDDDNAVPLLRDAAKFDTTTDAWKTYEKVDDGDIALPLTDREAKAIGDAVAANAGAFDNIDQAMTRAGVDWKITFSSRPSPSSCPTSARQRQLARLAINRAMLNYQPRRPRGGGRGRPAARCSSAARWTSTDPRQPPRPRSALSAASADTLAQMAPGMKIGEGAAR